MKSDSLQPNISILSFLLHIILFCHKKGQPVSPALLGQRGLLIFLFAFLLLLEGFSGTFKFRLENCWGNVRLPFMPDGSLCLVFCFCTLFRSGPFFWFTLSENFQNYNFVHIVLPRNWRQMRYNTRARANQIRIERLVSRHGIALLLLFLSYPCKIDK